MFLDDDDLFKLTRRRRRAAQMRVLAALGIEHQQRPDKSIVVLRAHVEQLFGGVANAKVSREIEPDWGRV